MSDVGNVKIVLGGTALRHTVIANQNKCWPHRQRQAKFPAFLPAFAPVLPPKPAARPQAAQPRLLPWSPPARPRQRLRASSNAVDANREQVESVGWARNHRALKSSMPIRPQYKWFYPIDWPQLSAVIRFGRAKGRCERCGRPHGREIRHLGDGRWWDEDERTWRNGRGRALSRLARRVSDDITVRTTRVALAAAHLDHDPTNNRLRNLKALCQRCHMLHDREEHRRRRLLTLRMRNAIGDLFLGLYCT